ncbi:Uncharacterized protein (Fragment), partial [Durusdinium trenchii]
ESSSALTDAVNNDAELQRICEMLSSELGIMKRFNCRQALDVVSDQECVKQEVKLRWTFALDQLLDDTAKSSTLAEVYELTKSKCQMDKKSTDEMLADCLGVPVHLTQSDMLGSLVLTQPQWLLDSLTRVICELCHLESRMSAMVDDLPTALR